MRCSVLCLFLLACPDYRMLSHVDEVVESAPPISYFVPVLYPDQVAEGTILFSDNMGWGSQRIVEVDREGRVVWSYDIPSEWTKMTVVLDVSRLESGNTLFSIDAVGVFEVNPEGDLVWSMKMLEASHDVDRLANGNTLVVDGFAPHGQKHVTEYSPDGEVVWSFDGAALDYAPLNEVENEGWLHVPGAERLEDGTTMITVRNLNRVIAVKEDGTLAWEVKLAESTSVTGQPFFSKRPHDAEFTGKGTILVPTHGPGVVVEIDIATGQHVWSWDAKVSIKGAQGPRDANRLSNGNTLITLGNRIVEVNPDGKIVWLLNSRRLSQPSGEEYPSAAGLNVNELVEMPRCFYKGVLVDPTGWQSGG